MAVNDFLPFCQTSTGTNLLTEAEYAASTDRTSGNKPGVASSKLNNKALRQSAALTSVLAQLVSDKTGTDVLDDGNPTKLLAQLNAAIIPLPPIPSRILSGTGTWNKSYVFFIATGSATVGATYTNNGITFTVAATVSSALQVRMTGSGAPVVSGTLTKASGTGDATLTFYAQRSAISLAVKLVGGGGGGGGSGVGSAGTGGTGGTTSFGTSLLIGAGGTGGQYQGANGVGGAKTVNAPALDLGSLTGSNGQGGGSYGGSIGGQFYGAGCPGGNSPLGGAGPAGLSSATTAASVNTGSGGGGGGMNAVVNMWGGGGGGSGGWVDALIPNPAANYAYAIGAGGTAGAAGPGGALNGGVAADGSISIIEIFQ